MVVDSFNFGGNNFGEVAQRESGRSSCLTSSTSTVVYVCRSVLLCTALRNTASGTLSIVIDDSAVVAKSCHFSRLSSTRHQWLLIELPAVLII